MTNDQLLAVCDHRQAEESRGTVVTVFATLVLVIQPLLHAEGAFGQLQSRSEQPAQSRSVTPLADILPLSIDQAGEPGVEEDRAVHERDEALRLVVQDCLAAYHRRPENAAERSPWGLMHAAIAFGVDTDLVVGERVFNALGWLCWNRRGNGIRLLAGS